MKAKHRLACAALFALATLAFGEGGKTLIAYAGTGIKDPVTEIAKRFEAKTGAKVELVYGNSGTLIGQLELNPKGDILMPGSMAFVEKARAKGLVALVSGPIAYHVPVIVTPKGNPANVKTPADMARPGLRLIFPDRKSTALGPLAFAVFDGLGVTQAVEKNVLAYVETPQKVVAAMLLGQGDAGIIEASNGTASADRLEIIPIDPAINHTEVLPCATLSSSACPDLAKAFLDFAVAEGPAIFRAYGFKTAL